MPATKPGRIDSIPSASGGIARMVCAELRERGIPLAPLLSKAGLSVEQIDDRAARVEVQGQIKILKLAADVLQDGLLGFHLSREYDLREIGLFYYVLASSEVLNDALQKAARYSRITNEGVSLTYRANKEVAISLDYVGVERRSDYHQIEFWLVSLVRLCRQLTNRRLIPSKISLVHHRKNTPAEFRSLLGCEIEFGAGADELVFPSAIAQLPIVSADSHLNQLLMQYCEDALAHRLPARTSLRASVENVMAPLLPHGTANAVEIARHLGMSHRTLARKLSTEGLTFSDIAEELRSDLAGHYLGDTDLPISQIAWLLGYREVSAFTHAFKRWTGLTPRQSRAQHPPAAVGGASKIRQRLRKPSGR
ncbi:AraC family transcriptional regulator [Bradyrhizobium sp. AUGA SZCCT0177]|uniref:AraC family transcriptional regulator n=1 Tax=Bradyrhizobium sp. AUGA SZCCT0177 TaxID=2807665 RepID=UPI0032DFFAC2